ncbi:hypothetical protein F2Q69_00026495 [Brassica cretica]|uniref:Uncharacterized protein n=1 Tax=Brassica cretica TaxID=69181 RepID=A0A8S9RST2_BRACR|nr:hypothetical protein F2Q69_00026495 [Brassica cretica]
MSVITTEPLYSIALPLSKRFEFRVRSKTPPHDERSQLSGRFKNLFKTHLIIFRISCKTRKDFARRVLMGASHSALHKDLSSSSWAGFRSMDCS